MPPNIIVPPVEIWSKINSEYHGSLIGDDKGITKTYRRIRKRYTWPGLRDEISEFIQGCNSFREQKTIRAHTREPMFITDTPADPFDRQSLVTVGTLRATPIGNRHILTMQDSSSKYCIEVPISELKTTTMSHVVTTTLFSQYGAPRYLLTDRRGSFMSNLMEHPERLLNVKQLSTSDTKHKLTDFLKEAILY